MNRRAETRFQVFSRVQVIPLDQPENPVSASLIDMSGAGFRLLADVELPLEKMFVVETDAHLILAEVRNSLPAGSRYATGLRKLHTISMLDLPQGAGRIESIQILINEYVLRKPTEPPVPSAVFAPEANEASNPPAQEKCPPPAPILKTGDPQSDLNLKPSTVAAPVPFSHESAQLIPQRRADCFPVWSTRPATSSDASLPTGGPAVPAHDPLTRLRAAIIPAPLSQPTVRALARPSALILASLATRDSAAPLTLVAHMRFRTAQPVAIYNEASRTLRPIRNALNAAPLQPALVLRAAAPSLENDHLRRCGTLGPAAAILHPRSPAPAGAALGAHPSAAHPFPQAQTIAMPPGPVCLDTRSNPPCSLPAYATNLPGKTIRAQAPIRSAPPSRDETSTARRIEPLAPVRVQPISLLAAPSVSTTAGLRFPLRGAALPTHPSAELSFPPAQNIAMPPGPVCLDTRSNPPCVLPAYSTTLPGKTIRAHAPIPSGPPSSNTTTARPIEPLAPIRVQPISLLAAPSVSTLIRRL